MIDAGDNRHHRPHALDMRAGMVYYSEPVWRRIVDPNVYPDELVAEITAEHNLK